MLELWRYTLTDMHKMAPEQQEKDISSFSCGGNKPESLILSYFSQEHHKTWKRRPNNFKFYSTSFLPILHFC